MHKIKQSILSGTFFLLVARLSNLSLGLGKFLLIAYTFGASTDTDAYFIAYNIIMFFLLGTEGTISTSFIPLLLQYRREKGQDEAWTMVSNLLHVILMLFLGFSIVLYFFSPLIVSIAAPGFSGHAAAVTQRLLIAMIPLIILSIFNVTLSTFYYADKRFLLPAAVSVLPTGGGLAVLFLLSDQVGIIALAYGMVGFSVIEALLLFIGLGRGRSQLLKGSMQIHEGVKEFFRLAVPRFLSLSLTEMNLMVDRLFVSFLGAGAVSAISYSGRLATLSSGTLTVPLCKSLFPHLTSMAIHKTKDDVLRTALVGVKSISLILIPWSVILILFHTDLTAIIFKHGQFSGHAVEMTAKALYFYSFGILFFAVNMLLRLILFAYKDTVTTLKISIIGALVNLILDYILVQYMGYTGIALSTTLVAISVSVSLLLFLSKKHQIKASAKLLKTLSKPLGAGLTVSVFLMVIDAYFDTLNPLFRVLFYSVCGVAVFILVYFKMDPEFGKQILNIANRRLKRRRSV